MSRIATRYVIIRKDLRNSICLTKKISFKYLRYVLHGIWCSKQPKVVGALYFVYRMTLIFKMTLPMIYKSKLSESAKKDIQNQVRQVLAYYLGQYVHMVNKYDNGIGSRIAKKKRASKKVEDDSEDSGGREEENKVLDDYETPPLKAPISGKPGGKQKGKAKTESDSAEKSNPNIVTVDLNKATPNQKKYVNNMLKRNETKKPSGRPKRNSTGAKSEATTSSKNAGNKRKSPASAQGKKAAGPSKKQKPINVDDADNNEKDLDENNSCSESEGEEND